MDQKREKNAHLWNRDPLDFYVEPEWCSVHLFEQVAFFGPIWDPACGFGRIVQAARNAGHSAVGSDVQKRSDYCDEIRDFIEPTKPGRQTGAIVSNPPFKHAEAFVERALELATHEVAIRAGDPVIR